MYRYDRRSLEKRRRERRRRIFMRWAVLLACIIVVVLVILIAARSCGDGTGGPSDTSSTEPTTTTLPTVDMTVEPGPGTTPADFSLSTGTYVNGEKVAAFTRPSPIFFGSGKDYTSLEGLVTFRGNNYRDTASYGTADITTGKLSLVWSVPSGSVAKSSGEGSWTGSGWTGQPLLVKWSEATKQVMNLKEEKKADPDLVEVIYPCLDGRIYFLDLKDGSTTRPVIESGGGPFKGTGSIYPNGIPLLFVGHGENAPNRQVVRARLYSLIDQSELYHFGTKPDPLSFRSFHAYDSSALFDASADTLIEPGENGILYTIRLNTHYDPVAGTLSIDPEEPVKLRYTAPDYSDAGENAPNTRWWGMEDSAVCWHNYLYVTDNGGKLMCFDLNSMRLIWVPRSSKNLPPTAPATSTSPPACISPPPARAREKGASRSGR